MKQIQLELSPILAMNLTPSPHPSPPMGERVSEGRVRGIAIGSRSQCIRTSEWGLSMNPVAQPSRLRVAAASRRQHEHRARRPVNSQARTPALHPPGSSWSQCTAKMARGLSMNLGAPASCRQRNLREALPTGRRQHLVGGTLRLVRGSGSQCIRKNESRLSGLLLAMSLLALIATGHAQNLAGDEALSNV